MPFSRDLVRGANFVGKNYSSHRCEYRDCAHMEPDNPPRASLATSAAVVSMPSGLGSLPTLIPVHGGSSTDDQQSCLAVDSTITVSMPAPSNAVLPSTASEIPPLFGQAPLTKKVVGPCSPSWSAQVSLRRSWYHRCEQE